MTHEKPSGKSDSLIFISHAEEDAEIALELSARLREAGYSTWCYEEQETPGLSYLEATAKAIEEASTFLLLISAASLASDQVIKEVEHAHDCKKPFLPVRYGISHADIQAARRIWRMAIGTSTSIDIPEEGLAALVPRLLVSLPVLESKDATNAPLPPVRTETKARKKPRAPLAQLRWVDVPRWARIGATLLAAALFIHLFFSRNFIIGKCVIKDDDGGETPFREGTVSFVVDSQEVTFDLRYNGYFAFPLESRWPLRGIELSFSRNDSEAHYPVRVGLASLLLNRRQTIYLRPNSRPLFQLGPAWAGIDNLSLSQVAYAQQAVPGAITALSVSPRIQTDLAKTIAITASVLKIDPSGISSKTDIRKDLRADSVALSRLIDALESQFRVYIDAKDWDQLGTVGEISAYVSGKKLLLSGVKDDILGILAATLSDYQKGRFYREPSIPGDKIAVARKAAQVPSSEKIFAMFDATLFGSASEALLFGDRGFYFATGWTASGPRWGFASYENFASRTFQKEDWSEVSLDNGQYFVVAGSRFKSQELANLLKVLGEAVRVRIKKNSGLAAAATSGEI